LQVKGEASTKAPFKYAVRVEDQKPKPGFAPQWLVASVEGDFQQWAIHLPAPETAWQNITLQLEPAAHVQSLQIERADLLLLNCKTEDSALPHPNSIHHLGFSSDGQHVWAQIEDEVQCFAWPDGTAFAPWTNPQHANTGAANTRAVQPVGKGALIGTRDGCIVRLAGPEGSTAAVWQGPGKEVTTLVVCEDANLVLAGAETGKVRGLNYPSGEVLFDLSAAEEAILALDATPDGEWMVTSTLDRQLKIWRRSPSGYEIYCQLPETSGVVREVHLSPDGSKLAVLGRANGMIVLWDLAALQQEFKRLDIE
jgi:WD40 repeat protein